MPGPNPSTADEAWHWPKGTIMHPAQLLVILFYVSSTACKCYSQLKEFRFNDIFMCIQLYSNINKAKLIKKQ